MPGRCLGAAHCLPISLRRRAHFSAGPLVQTFPPAQYHYSNVESCISGHACRRPVRETAFVALLATSLLATGFGPSLARAAQVTDVRVGLHPGFTRVVVETDEPVEYLLLQPLQLDDFAIRLRVEAESSSRVARPPGSRMPPACGSSAAGHGDLAIGALCAPQF